MLDVNEFFHGTRIKEGYGVLKDVGQEVKTLGGHKVLVVTDTFLLKTKIFEILKESLEEAGIAYVVSTQVKPNPRATDCDEVAALARQEAVDMVIALGGGSNMDEAKCVAALLTNGKTAVEWGDVELEHDIMPLICIPTTAGTGSEVTWCAVITDLDRHYKMTVGDPVHLLPKLAICDPEVTLGLPQSLTASCGVDALTHAIEAYTVKIHTPFTDPLAMQAIRLISKNLLKAYENGQDREARRNMMLASTIAGMSFISSNVGAVHAIAETVGGLYDIPHGVANSLFLPYVMAYNIPACPERFCDIAEAMGIARDGLNDNDYAQKAVDFVVNLNKQLHIPTLKELPQIPVEDFEKIAERSAHNILSNDNAKTITKEDYLDILKKAYEGQ